MGVQSAVRKEEVSTCDRPGRSGISPAEHYKSKIAVYIKWYMDRGYPDGIPDEADLQMEKKRDVPSWRRICRTLLRNDYWCKQLGFSPTKQSAYERYIAHIKQKRNEWGIFAE